MSSTGIGRQAVTLDFVAITVVDTISDPDYHYSRRSFLAGVIACGTISAAASYAITGRPAGRVDLRLASGDDRTGARNLVIDAFNAQSDSTRVVLRSLTSETSDQKKTMRGWAETGQVDIVNLDVIHIQEFAEAGLIEPISLPSPKDFLHLKLLLPVDPQSVDAEAGPFWAAPFNADVGMLFRQQPVPEPVTNDPLDLATVLSESVAEQSEQSKLRQFAGQLQPANSAADEAFVVNVLEHALSHDSTIVDPEKGMFDVERWRTALTPLRKAIQTRSVLPLSDEDDTQARFAGGGLGYMRNWPVRYRYIQKERSMERDGLRLVLRRMSTGGILGGQSLAIVKRSPYVEQAQEAIRYLTDTPAQKVLAMHGLSPTRVDAYNDKDLNVLMPHLAGVRGAVEEGHLRPRHRNYAGFSRAVRQHVYPFLHDKGGTLGPKFTDDLTNALK